MKLTTIIIDGDAVARASLSAQLEQLPQIKLYNEFESISDAKKYLETEEVDLIFFDTNDIGKSERELLDSLSRPPQIVLTTANSGLIVDALEFELSDMILKPYSLPRLSFSIQKVIKTEKMLKEIAYSSKANEIYVKENGKLVRIAMEDIYYFENAGDYVKVITEKKSHIIAGALKNIARRLRHPRLLKIHRSFIVHLNKIVDIEDHSIELENGKVIPISRAHKPTLMKSLNII